MVFRVINLWVINLWVIRVINLRNKIAIIINLSHISFAGYPK